MDLFRETQILEEAPFLGDSSFWSYLEELVARQIIQVEEETEFRPPWRCSDITEFRRQCLALALPLGFLVFSNSRIHFGPDPGTKYSRWMGGSQITEADPWWWDPDAGRLTQTRSEGRQQ